MVELPLVNFKFTIQERNMPVSADDNRQMTVESETWKTHLYFIRVLNVLARVTAVSDKRFAGVYRLFSFQFTRITS